VNDFSGRSLSWARQILGLPPRYGTCNDAIAALDPDPSTDPPLGSLVWWRNDSHGDVGIAVDSHFVLTLQGGRPILCDLICPRHGTYAGWTAPWARESGSSR
jgi:hypothetical protein